MIVTIGLSPLGPIGIGRAAEPSPGNAIDVPVILVGLSALAFAEMCFGVVPVLTIRRRAGSVTSSRRSPRTRLALPPTGVAGWAMTSSRRAGGSTLGSAIIGVAMVYAAGIAAWSLVLS